MGSYGTIFQHISTNKKIQKGYEVAWKKRTEAATARTGRFARLKASLKTNISQYLPQDVDFPTGK